MESKVLDRHSPGIVHTFGAGRTGKTTLHAERTAILAAEALAASDGDVQRY